MKTVIGLLFSIFLFSCQEAILKDTVEKKGKNGAGSSKATANKISSFNSDTVLISGKSVVFFSISQDEYDKTTQEENSGFDEALSDFNYYSSEVIDSLGRASFKTIFTTSKTFALENNKGLRSYITKNPQQGKLGVLLYDGKNNPMLYYGVLADMDYISIVEEYFKD